MRRMLALLLVAAVSFLTPALVVVAKKFNIYEINDFKGEIRFAWLALGLFALGAISDKRMTPWFARLGGRLFLGSGRGLWMSAGFTLVLIVMTGLWAHRLITGGLFSTEGFIETLLLFVVTLAPWEEILWRGVWFAAASNVYWSQVLLGSALFALGHASRLDGSSASILVQAAEFFSLFVQGAALASLRRLGAPLVILILLHGFYNVLVNLHERSALVDANWVNAGTFLTAAMAIAALVVGVLPRGPRDAPPR